MERKLPEDMVSEKKKKFRAAMARSLVLELPENIIYHIFSYLTNEGAIRLSLASKQMRDLIEKLPTLSFIKKPIAIKELKYMHSTLKRYHRENIPLKSFTLTNADCDLSRRCIKLAAKKGLRILNLGQLFSTPPCPSEFLPQVVFEVESLVELELSSFCLNPKNRVAWPNLKRLSLTNGCEASVKAFKNIIRGCPLIENLKLHLYFAGFVHGCPEIVVMNFSHLRNLKQLNVHLYYNQYLEVNASSTPNLESITCAGGRPGGSLDLGNTEFHKLRTLDLEKCVAGINEQLFSNFASRFPVLETLSLNLWADSKRMNLSSTSLKEIRLGYMGRLQDARLEVPNLRFEYQKPDQNRLSPELWLFKKNSGKWGCRIDLTRSGIDNLWFFQLNELLAALNGSEISIVTGLRMTSDVDYQDIEESVISVPWNIREFSVDTMYWRPSLSSSVSVFLDAIFLICRPQTITFLNHSNCEFLSLLYEKLSKNHPGSVTDFDMFQGSARIEDWDEFLEVLEADHDGEKTVENISLRLKYGFA